MGLGAQAQVDNRLGFSWNSGPVLRLSSTSAALPYAFSGGMDLPQWSKVDLNRDGILDLVAFDRGSNRWIPFLAQNQSWVAAPFYADSLPRVTDWALFRDYDYDGDRDLFHASIGGIGVHENTSTLDTLTFNWALGNYTYVRTDVGSFTTNLYNINSDIPSILDVDDDGDLDIFTFGQRASIEFHEGLTAGGLDFQLNTSCWGRFEEGAFTNNLFLGGCAGVPKTETGLHAGSTTLLINLNGDSLYDVLIGDVEYTNVVAAYNGGHVDSAYMTTYINNFPTTEPIDLDLFPAFFYEDINFDSIPDLLLAPNLKGAINTQNSWVKTNSGSKHNPNFSLIDSSFMNEGMLDLGSAAHPALIDIDFDGDFDLFVGSAGVRTAPGIYDASIYYFKNVGSSTVPVFELASSDFAQAGLYNLSSELAPALGDLDGDYDADMVVGTSDGKLYYYENTGGLFTPVMTYRGQLQNIDVGNSAAPAIGDLDQDGLNDLLIGNELGDVAYYRQTGSFPNLFTLVSSQWAGISTQTPTSPSGYSTPAFVFSTDTSLLVGSNNMGIVHLDSIAQILSGTSQVDVQFSSTSSTVSTDRGSTPFGGSVRNGRVQFTLLASEITALGGTFGKVAELGFELGNTNGLYLTQGFTVRMAHVDGSLSGSQSSFYPETAYTTVYSGIRVLSQGWNTIPLTTPFEWNGTDHISIEICFSKHAQTGDIPVKLHTAPGYLYHYGEINGWNGITQSGCLMPYGDSLITRPNVKLGIIPTLLETEHYASAAGYRVHPAVADVNGDGYPDMMVGTSDGGLLYFEGQPYVQSSIGIEETISLHSPAGTLKLFPNPSSGVVTLEGDGLDGLEADIYTLQGKKVGTLPVGQPTLIQLPAGLYLLHLSNPEGGYFLHKLIIE